MSSTVQVGAWQIQSSDESAEEMVKVLTPEKDTKAVPKPIKDRGKEVEGKPEKAPITVQEAGKRGAEAAAKAREARVKEADSGEKEAQIAPKEADKPVDTDEDKAEAKSKQDKAESVDKSEDKEAKPEEREGNPRHDAQARIRELAREKAEAKREAEEARREAMALRAEIERARQPQPPVQPRREAQAASEDDPEPVLDQYETWDEYNKAQAAHAARAEFRRLEQERNIQRHREAQARYFQEQQQRFVERFEAAKQADPEIADKIDPELLGLLHTTPQGERPTPSSALADEVFFRADNPAAILRHFTENPDEVRRIVGLPDPFSIARAVALLDARFAPRGEAASEPERRPSAAPPPITPISASPQPGQDDLTGEMDFDTYMKKLRGKKR